MKLQIKHFFIFLLIVGIFITFLVSRKLNSTAVISSEIDPSKLQVTTSFYPLYYFASQIGGERANVVNITPPGAEPHDYEPTTTDLARIEGSKLLVLNGAGLETWGSKVSNNLKNKQIEIVESATGLATLQMLEDGKTVQDPHVWLDPVLAKEEVSRILEGFVKVDPVNKIYYQNNAKTLNLKLDRLYKEYKDGLSKCMLKDIVTSHAAFGYLAQRFGLKQIAISGLSPDSEPSPRNIANIVDEARTNDIKYIFFEELVSPKLAETIAREVGAKTLVFDPLEGLTPVKKALNKDFIQVEEDNLSNLKIALECN